MTKTFRPRRSALSAAALALVCATLAPRPALAQSIVGVGVGVGGSGPASALVAGRGSLHWPGTHTMAMLNQTPTLK